MRTIKNLLTTVFLCVSSFAAFSQNTFPSSGNAGVGTTTPRSKLEITGAQNIDWQESDNTKGTGLLTVGSSGAGGSVFINTPTHYSYYTSGLGIDGNYDNDNRLSLINLKAFGVKYASWHSSMAFHTSDGASLIQALRLGYKRTIDWQESDATKGTGLVTIGTPGTDGSLFINMPTHDPYYTSGFGVDGSYISAENRSQINIKAYGVKYSGWKSSLSLFTSNGATMVEAMHIDHNGNVGIGSANTGSFRLAVDGKIGAREALITLASPWPDYVFAGTYHLPSLEELDAFIRANKHLPEVPAAATIEKEGVPLGEMSAVMMKKIEELTLYLIEAKKENNSLKTTCEQLLKQQAELQERLTKLEQTLNTAGR